MRWGGLGVRAGLPALGVAVAFGAAGYALVVRPELRPIAQALEVSETREVLPVREALEALRVDGASAYRWADLGDAYAAVRQIEKAEGCFARAMELAPAVPAIWMRDANFRFLAGQFGAALQSAGRVLETTGSYDGILFLYFSAMQIPNVEVLRVVRRNGRASRAWLEYLIANRKLKAARETWNQIFLSGQGEKELLDRYTAYLLSERDPVGAVREFSAWVKAPKESGYPWRNFAYNGELREKPGAGPFEWRLPQEAERVVSRWTPGRIEVEFLGKANLNYYGPEVLVALPSAGRYVLDAVVDADGISTDEGPRISIADLGLASESILGNVKREGVRIVFGVEQARTIRVAVTRRPSERFDNKIAGKFGIGRWQVRRWESGMAVPVKDSVR